ncbi:MAG: hypothetical protein R2800_13480 [Flavipsychrobacter sp.]
MKYLLFFLLSIIPIATSAQFHNVATKTIEKIVDKIDRDATLKRVKKTIDDTTLIYFKQGQQIHKIAETIKRDTSFIHRDYYYNDGALVFILESKRRTKNDVLTQVLFSKSYYTKGKRIYNTTTTHNNSTSNDLKPTESLLQLATYLYTKATHQ